MTEAALSLGHRRQMRLRPLVSVSLALAIGLVAWLFLRPGHGESPSLGAPRAVGVTQLRNLSAALGHNLYWAGAPGAGVKLELTRQSEGQVYIRYLSGGGRVGDHRASFTTVGTYPVPTAFAALRREAKGPAAITRSLSGGGLAYMSARHPTSVYLAWPGSRYEVEVFDPSPKHALDLVLSDAIAPIR